jgi:hypothetical protein
MQDGPTATESAARTNEARGIASVVMGTRSICCAWDRRRRVPQDPDRVGLPGGQGATQNQNVLSFLNVTTPAC